MGKFFNIAGPCVPSRHYMLPASARLPDVMRLVKDEAYFRGATYPVEVKMLYNFERNPDKAYDQVARYIDHLGQSEGWLVIFDPDLAKPWEGKLYARDLAWKGKSVHVIGC